MESVIADCVHKLVLRRCLPSLLDELDIMAVLDFLHSDDVISVRTLRDISEQKTTTNKCRELVKQLTSASRHDYETFLKCLDQVGQPYLSDKLKEEEQKIIKEIEATRTRTRTRASTSANNEETTLKSPSVDSIGTGTNVDIGTPRAAESTEQASATNTRPEARNNNTKYADNDASPNITPTPCKLTEGTTASGNGHDAAEPNGPPPDMSENSSSSFVEIHQNTTQKETDAVPTCQLGGGTAGTFLKSSTTALPSNITGGEGCNFP